jgi:hypothetical protein
MLTELALGPPGIDGWHFAQEFCVNAIGPRNWG